MYIASDLWYDTNMTTTTKYSVRTLQETTSHPDTVTIARDDDAYVLEIGRQIWESGHVQPLEGVRVDATTLRALRDAIDALLA